MMRRHLSSTGSLFILSLALLVSAPHAEELSLSHMDLTLKANLETTNEGWRQGPVVLMTHGTLAHGRMEIMETLQSALKDRGMSSLSMTLSLGLDNRQGMYDCATPHGHAHTDAVEEIGAWLGWLRSQGVTQVALLGHSRGGNQVARFAADRSEASLSAVILIAPQTWSPDSAAADYQRRFGRDLASQLEAARRLQAEGKGGELMRGVGFIYCDDTSATADTFLSYHELDPGMDTPALIPQIKAPVLVVAGTEDDVVPGLVEKVQPQADGTRVRLMVLDGADHFFRDLYAEEIADAVQALLGG